MGLISMQVQLIYMMIIGLWFKQTVNLGLSFFPFSVLDFLLPHNPFSSCCQHPTAEASASSGLPEAFAEACLDDSWDDAKLGEAIRYVRGSKLLRIPESWRNSLPTRL